MTGTSEQAGTEPESRFAFSTDFLPERDRVEFLREEASRIMSLEIAHADEAPPHYAVEWLRAGSVDAVLSQGSATRISRGKAQLADGDESFVLVLHGGGGQHIDHGGRTTSLGPGEACLIFNGRPAVASCPQASASAALRFPRAALTKRMRDPEAIAGQRIAVDRAGLSLLKGYLRSFRAAEGPLSATLLDVFGGHIIDLVVSMLEPTPDGAAAAEAGGVRAARLRLVLDRIAARACDPRFGVETVAVELGVTSRTVQHILEETGSTFSEHVAERRLHCARDLLVDPRSRLSIAEIAYESGFNDLSHFYRAFRRRFGETPAAARANGAALH